MPRSDLSRLSAPRVELDQRSREARLRLEHVERLLVVRPLPRLSFLKRVLRRLGLRIYIGKQVEGRSGKVILANGRLRRGRRMPGETAGGAGSFCAAPWDSWPNSARGGRTKSVRLYIRPGHTDPQLDGSGQICCPVATRAAYQIGSYRELDNRRRAVRDAKSGSQLYVSGLLVRACRLELPRPSGQQILSLREALGN
jgi:hypothetical protein